MEQTVMMEKKKRSLVKSRSFILLWFAAIMSSLSMSMFMFIQSWYVVEELGVEAALGMILISLSVPRIVFMMVGGVWSDRSNQSRIMFLSDLCRAILAVGLALCFMYLPEVSIPLLAVNAALFGMLGGLFEPARDSILPMVVDKEDLTRANALMQGAMQIALFSGPLLAGVLISWGNYSSVFFIISSGLLIAGVGIFFVRLEKAAQTASLGGKGFVHQLKEGFIYTWQSPLLRALFIIAVIVNFFISGPLLMGLPIFVEGILQGDSQDFSYVQGGLTLGMIIGSIIMGMLNLRTKRGTYALALMAFQGAGIFCFSQSDSLWTAVVIIIAIGVFNPAVNIPLISMIQAHTDTDKIGRVMSLIRMASFGLIPLSYAVTSIILGFGVAINEVMAWSAIPLILSVVVLFFKFPILRTVD